MSDAESDLAENAKPTLHKTNRLLNEFRKLDGEMPIQQAQTFIYCALREDDVVNIKDVADGLGISQASASRNVNAFMKINRYRKAGHDLLQTHEDPMHRSRKIITLTAKGKLVKQSIMEIMQINDYRTAR